MKTKVNFEREGSLNVRNSCSDSRKSEGVNGKYFGREKFIYLLPYYKPRKMTLIIGLKCREGVILVSDKKVTNYGSNKAKWVIKLHKPLESVTSFYGASGYAHLFKEFNRRIPLVVEQKLREYELRNYSAMKKLGVDYYETLDIKEENPPKELQKSDVEEQQIFKKSNKKYRILPKAPLIYGHEDFIKDCQSLIKEMSENDDNTFENNLEVLLTLIDERGTRLHRINFLEEDEGDYFAIGSGSIFVNEFFEKFYNPEKSLDYCMKLAMFCILYVQKYVNDFSVGIPEGTLPDNQVILNDGQFGPYKFNDEEGLIKELNEKVEKFIKLQDSLEF